MQEFDPLYGPFRIHASLNGRFPEIWMFYPTAGQTEANRYVIWNYVENWWAWGMLRRSAMSPAVAYTEPFMGTATGLMYEHDEPGQFTDNGQPRFQDIFIESGALGIGSERIVDINGLQMATGLGAQIIRTTFFAQYTPEGAETTFGPYAPRADGYTDTRVSARNARIRWQPSADGPWGIGTTKLMIADQTSGARR
jgi:hypothetical protein